MDIAIGQPAVPKILEVLLRIGVVVAMNEPYPVKDAFELDVKRLFRLNVAQKNDC